LAPRTVQIGEEFEIRLDIVNVAKNSGTLIKVEGLVPSGFKVIYMPSFCSIKNRSIKLNNEEIGPFQARSIKIRLMCSKSGIYHLEPCLIYIDDLRKSRRDKAKEIPITVQLGSSEKTKTAELIEKKLEFNSEATEKAFNYLLNAFEKDYLIRRMPLEKSGWRTLMEVAKNSNITIYSMYGRSGQGGKVTTELVNLGVVESRFFHGERGRGGRILKMRIFYEKEHIKKRLEQQRHN
jgi:hypothetical protein